MPTFSCRDFLENKTIEGTSSINAEIRAYNGGSNQVCGDQLYQITYDGCPVYFTEKNCHYSHHYSPYRTPPFDQYCYNQSIEDGRCWISIHNVSVGDTVSFKGVVGKSGLVHSDCYANETPDCRVLILSSPTIKKI